MTITKAPPTFVFDNKLHRFKDITTRRIIPTPKEPWVCLKSPVGAHYWLHEGYCKYCGDLYGNRRKEKHANIR